MAHQVDQLLGLKLLFRPGLFYGSYKIDVFIVLACWSTRMDLNWSFLADSK